MRKFKYTKEESAEISAARKVGKGLSKVVKRIREKCLAEGRFEDIEKLVKTAKKIKEEVVSESSVVIK